MECKDLASAQSLVSTARLVGFRDSGITNVNNKRVIVAICCSIRLEVPLGTTESVMVSPEFILTSSVWPTRNGRDREREDLKKKKKKETKRRKIQTERI